MIREYVVIDLEMTGICPKKDEILEIGAVKITEGRREQIFQCLVRPTVPIPARVTELTGITEEMADQGKNVDDAMREFLVFSQDLPLVGHQLMCDYGFLKRWAVNHRVPMERKGLDTLKLARKFLPKEQKKSLPELCRYYGIAQRSHRALPDARATEQILRNLADAFEADHEASFVPKELRCNMKRETPATLGQIEQLGRYIRAYGLEEEFREKNWKQFTRSEASRAVDRIIFRFGKLKREREE